MFDEKREDRTQEGRFIPGDEAVGVVGVGRSCQMTRAEWWISRGREDRTQKLKAPSRR